jgi:hypothetical protein
MHQDQPETEPLPFSVELLRRQLALFDEIAESSGAAAEAPMLTKIVRLSFDGIVSQMEAANGWLLDFMESFDDESKAEALDHLLSAVLVACQPLRNYEGKNLTELKKLVATFNDCLDVILGRQEGMQLLGGLLDDDEDQEASKATNGSKP